MKRLLSYMKKYRRLRPWRCFVLFETFLELIIPLIMADMVDVGIANGDKAYIFEKGLMMAVCAMDIHGTGCRQRQIRGSVRAGSGCRNP